MGMEECWKSPADFAIVAFTKSLLPGCRQREAYLMTGSCAVKPSYCVTFFRSAMLSVGLPHTSISTSSGLSICTMVIINKDDNNNKINNNNNKDDHNLYFIPFLEKIFLWGFSKLVNAEQHPREHCTSGQERWCEWSSLPKDTTPELSRFKLATIDSGWTFYT